MNKIWILCLLIVTKGTAQIQQDKASNRKNKTVLTANKFLEGYAWVYERNDNFPNADQSIWIYNENRLYNIENEKIPKKPISFYCFFERSPFRYIDSVKNDVYIPIPKDSIFLDLKINPIGNNDLFVTEDADTIPNPNIENQHGTMSYSFVISMPNHIETNRTWLPSPTTIGGITRILEPPQSVQDFIRYLRRDKMDKISNNKVIINKSPGKPSQMYLLKGDEVEILETKDDWLKIRYYGSKTIEGWIKKTDVE